MMTSTTFGLLTAISDVSHTSLGVHINQLDELNQMPPFSGLCNLWLMSDGMILKDGVVRTIRTASPGTILCTDIAKSWLYDHSYTRDLLRTRGPLESRITQPSTTCVRELFKSNTNSGGL